MNPRSRWARTKVVAQAAVKAAIGRNRLDNARTSGALVNERYQPQRPTTKAGVR